MPLRRTWASRSFDQLVQQDTPRMNEVGTTQTLGKKSRVVQPDKSEEEYLMTTVDVDLWMLLSHGRLPCTVTSPGLPFRLHTCSL